MLKVNLEKELIKQNHKTLVAKELLELKEYETVYKGLDEDRKEAIERFGIKKQMHVHSGKSAEKKIEIEQHLRDKYGDRLFHISQIKKVCIKYRLRFLGFDKYKGSVDPLLLDKLMQFEIANNVKFNGYSTYGFWIAAPASSFELKKRPKDPLFFIGLPNDGWYVLIHKWGNDLNFFRRVTCIYRNYVGFFNLLFLALYVLYPGLKTFYNPSRPTGFPDWVLGIFGILIPLLFFMFFVCIPIMYQLTNGGMYEDDWDSEFE